jgi:hypothetical protein
VVGGDAIHIDGLLGDSAEEVSSSDDDPDLTAESVYGCDLFGYFVDEDRIDTEAPAGSQSFS